jgi:hypothetical protein
MLAMVKGKEKMGLRLCTYKIEAENRSLGRKVLALQMDASKMDENTFCLRPVWRRLR